MLDNLRHEIALLTAHVDDLCAALNGAERTARQPVKLPESYKKAA